ncbi:MAG: DUF1311 domain-containing protein [Rhodocyclales bacterium]|nr:DUF1311 domain-containing protein [Rhodocyclales bacterium]
MPSHSLTAAILLVALSSGTSGLALANSDCDRPDLDHSTQVQCIATRIRALDSELNRTYQAALSAMPETSPQDRRKEREQLRKSQRAWLKYKQENCTLVGAIEGGSNLAVTHHAGLCEEEALKERISFLKGVADASSRL